jgi:hypothetical protein
VKAICEMSSNFATNQRWDGTKVAHEYKLKLCVVQGDLQILLDAPFFDDEKPNDEDCINDDTIELIPLRHPNLLQHECAAIHIASGLSGLEPEECEFIEIVLGPHGHYFMKGFSGQGDDMVDTNMTFEQPPEIEIDNINHRWCVKASIPFFYLPAPGDDPNDNLALIWNLNFIGVHNVIAPTSPPPSPMPKSSQPDTGSQGINNNNNNNNNNSSSGNGNAREYISLVKLPGNKIDFYQLNEFASLILSDAQSQRLRSISRASVSMKSTAAQRAIDDAFNDEAFFKPKHTIGNGYGNDSSYASAQAADAHAANINILQKKEKKNDDTDMGLNNNEEEQLELELKNAENETVEQILTRFLLKYKNDTDQQLKILIPDAKYMKLLFSQNVQKNEQIILVGKYWKRKGWSHNKCILILTTLGKLMYFDSTPPYTFRGNIDWKLTRPLRPIEIVRNVRFDIELADCSRTYHFYDEEGYGVSKWLNVIKQVNVSRRAYLIDSLGQYDADVMEAMSRRAKKKNDYKCNIL